MSGDDLRQRFGVTGDQLDEWAGEYEGDDWSHMRFGEIINGRPRLSDEPLDSITVKVPHSRAVAMGRVQQETGMTKSEFVRRAIDNELLAMG